MSRRVVITASLSAPPLTLLGASRHANSYRGSTQTAQYARLARAKQELTPEPKYGL